ncbi:MAG: diacylglycerol kinase family protein [Thermoanaerobaculia bacterium]
MKRGILVYNPTAGQRDLRRPMNALIDRLRRRGLELVNAPTSGPGDATEIVRTFLTRGIDLVAVCGGDGTISEAAAGLGGSPVPLGVLPGGTSNVLAVELGIPLELRRAEEVLLAGVPVSLRLGRADGRPFLLWAGVGLDARVMRKMNLTLKRWFGRPGISPTAGSQFLRYEFPRLEVEIDGARHEATFAVVSRARHYGGNWIIAPEARTDADTLDVLLFAHRDRWKLFRLFQEMKRGQSGHLTNGLARIVRGREVSIRSLESYPVDVQVDGDCVLETPVACSVGEERVRILVPGGKSTMDG